jgi:outer membrane protein TolC
LLKPDARGVVKLSLEQVAIYALAGNQDLAVARYGPVLAGTFRLVESGVFDPQVYAGLTYNRENAQEYSSTRRTTYKEEETEIEAGTGVRQKLPTGTTIDLSLSHTATDSNQEPDQHNPRLGLTVTQALLQGYGPAVNLVKVRQTMLGERASLYQLRGFSETLLADAETAYWQFVLAGQSIAIFQSSLDLARRQLKEVRQRIEVGSLPEMEAAAAGAEVARREQALIEAKSQLSERRLRLLRYLNPDPDGGLTWRIEAVSKPDIKPQPLKGLQQRLELANKMRPDLNQARLELKQNRLETILTKNGLLPRLDFFIALGKSGFARSFGPSYQDLDGPSHDISAGLSLSHYLGNRSARGKDLAARFKARQSAAALANLGQLFDLEVRLAANEVERAAKQITASRTTRLLQEKTAQAEKERFNVGSGTALQVAQAQRDLLAASINEVAAVVAYRIALVQLYQAEGSLLERRGVTVDAGKAL